jgi:IS605 OrfB family transposase
VKLAVALKLMPSDEQVSALRLTLHVANVAANAISARAWRERRFGQFKLHKLVYAETRAASGLSAQMVVRLIAKVADAYKLDCSRQRRFALLGSVAYDDRILRYSNDGVSIWTLAGRQYIPFVCNDHQRRLLARRDGESDLVYRERTWFLYATVNVAEDVIFQPVDVLGVDLGIRNIAADSDGNLYAGGHVNGLRHRQRRLRQRLQRKRTRSARRRLQARRRKEGRFATSVNHTISKRIVAEAQCTQRAIALENLGGIRARIKARRPQRATLHSWAFHQLCQFVAYKAALAGVPLVYVDPRNTSRTCPECGLVDARNRPTQARFQCVVCGLAGHADTIAAENIRVQGWGVCNASIRGGSGVLRVEASSRKPPALAGGPLRPLR